MFLKVPSNPNHSVIFISMQNSLKQTEIPQKGLNISCAGAHRTSQFASRIGMAFPHEGVRELENAELEAHVVLEPWQLREGDQSLDEFNLL